MASTSKAAAKKSILTPSMTLKGHKNWIGNISYFPDGQRMISGSGDKTARQWDLKGGREIEEVREVYEEEVHAVAVSRDGRWIVIGKGDYGGEYDSDADSDSGELQVRVCEVETGTVKKLRGHSERINCIDISADNTLLASGSDDSTARIWNLETGKLVASPVGFGGLVGLVGTVRFSTDSKKLAVMPSVGSCLAVWDIQSQKLVSSRSGNQSEGNSTPIFWTNKNKNILAAFSFTEDDDARTIYEFDALTLETVGTPFEGHTEDVTGLALSFDGALVASSSYDDTIKLWAFESRQLLASFDVQHPDILILSPDSRKLAYTTYRYTSDPDLPDYKYYWICICDTPPDILARAQARTIVRTKPALVLSDPLNPDGTRRLISGCRKRPINVPPSVYPPPTLNPQQPSFRLSKLLRFSPRMNALRPGRNDQPRDSLNVPATLPLSSSLSGQAATQYNHFETGSPPPRSNRSAQSLRQHLSFFAPKQSLTPSVVEVAPGRKFTRLAVVKLPEYKKVDDTRHPSNQQATVPQDNDTSDVDSLPDAHWCNAFLCYCSCWSHGRPRMPPRWRLERVDIPRQDGTTNGGHSGVNGRS